MAPRYYLFLFLLPSLLKAQTPISGLGPYHIGITTIDSILNADFTEADQSYVKGTIALPCSHIRIRRATRTKVAGHLVTNLSLFFYDDILFKISCDYPADLQKLVRLNHGNGNAAPKHSFTFCTKPAPKPMLVWGETWLSADVRALAIHSTGYAADCKFEESSQLSISSQRMSALSSDCELSITNALLEEYDKFLKAQPESTVRH